MGVYYRNSKVRIADIADGMSHTVMVGERAVGLFHGIWAGAINNGVILRGASNTNPVPPARFPPRRSCSHIAI